MERKGRGTNPHPRPMHVRAATELEVMCKIRVSHRQNKVRNVLCGNEFSGLNNQKSSSIHDNDLKEPLKLCMQ
jgi:hypothetical protein